VLAAEKPEHTPAARLSIRMKPVRRLRTSNWWWWLATGAALASRLAGWGPGLAAAMGLTALRGLELALRHRSVTAFPVQVRAAYLAILAAGGWPPLVFLHAMQLAGTTALVVLDYCPLARILSLLPWNRRGPLTLARVKRTFLSPPVNGSVQHAFDDAAAPSK
jgi:hypothetical protein